MAPVATPTPSATPAEHAASAQQTLRAINEACRSKGGHYAGYSCKVVSWDDVSRGTVGGSLSCWGSNITDTYLKAKDGTSLFTVRPDNWNEKLGRVSAQEVALVAGDTLLPSGGQGSRELKPVTLRDFLARAGDHGAYAGLSPGHDLSNADLDSEVSIRFQTTFLPIAGGDARGALEFAPEAYNYNTTSDEDPRNLVLLCTTQGVAVQQDGAGAKRLFHHAVDDEGTIHRYWLEAERSDHKVGGAQKESAQEKADALARGKATASVIGTRAMGARFNLLMTIQIPLEQQQRSVPQCVSYSPTSPGNYPFEAGCGLLGCIMMDDGCIMMNEESKEEEDDDDELELSFLVEDDCDLMEYRSERCVGEARMTGVANAARVSRGSEHDTWAGLGVKHAPKRNPHEHVTVTVVLYNTVAGGVPSADDVAAAVDDLESLYAACGAQGRLGDTTFDFMKQQLTVADADKISFKVATQPPPSFAPPVLPVVGSDVFPGGA